MSELWRCDVCHDLIDPIEGDERTVLQVGLSVSDDKELRHLDLCESCRPSSIEAHMDWLTFEMEDSE